MADPVEILVLGAGLAGLAASHHLGHEQCLLLEAKSSPYGHTQSSSVDGFVWDEGPHVSFTKSDYVKRLFAASAGEVLEFEASVANFFRGSWIDHPAQSNLYQVPEPLRSECLAAFPFEAGTATPPADYAEWLEQAFGVTFAREFPFRYTRKYWTREPAELSTAWVGSRVFRPNADDVRRGALGPLGRQTHYISTVRYPARGGFQSFVQKLREGARIVLGARVTRVDLARREVWDEAGRCWSYKRLCSTIPLPALVRASVGVPSEVQAAADALAYTELRLVNVAVPHPARRRDHWLYVYDEELLSTRLSFTEHLSRGNAPEGCCGIQVEIYEGVSRRSGLSDAQLSGRVVDELVTMGLIDEHAKASARAHVVNVPYGNVIFDHARESALDTIFSWLARFGLEREPDDLAPTTAWGSEPQLTPAPLSLAGRYAQWKYFWTDDCVLRGRQVAGGRERELR